MSRTVHGHPKLVRTDHVADWCHVLLSLVFSVPAARGAAELRQATADEVSDRQQRDQEPRPVGPEVVVVVGVDANDLGRDQHSTNRGEEDPELAALDRQLRLVTPWAHLANLHDLL